MPLIKVAISGINASENPAPGTGIARSLIENHDLNYELYGLAYDVLEPGIYLNWLFTKCFLTPYPSATHEIFIERLTYIQQQTNIQVIIPSLKSELPFYMKNVPFLQQLGIHTFLPSEHQFKLCNKHRLADVAEQMRVNIAKQQPVTSQDELIIKAQTEPFPIILKDTLGNAYINHNLNTAIATFCRLANESGLPILMQEIIPGEEIHVIGIGDGQGSIIGIIAARKMNASNMDKIWTGVTVKNQDLYDATQQFIQHTQWRGPFEFKFIVNHQHVYLIEINPCLPSWVYLATGAGINLPAMLVKLALGQNVTPNLNYLTGKMFIRYTSEIVGDMHQFQNMVMKGEA